MFDGGVVEYDGEGEDDETDDDGLDSGVLGFFLDEELDFVDGVWIEVGKALHLFEKNNINRMKYLRSVFPWEVPLKFGQRIRMQRSNFYQMNK